MNKQQYDSYLDWLQVLPLLALKNYRSTGRDFGTIFREFAKPLLDNIGDRIGEWLYDEAGQECYYYELYRTEAFYILFDTAECYLVFDLKGNKGKVDVNENWDVGSIRKDLMTAFLKRNVDRSKSLLSTVYYVLFDMQLPTTKPKKQPDNQLGLFD